MLSECASSIITIEFDDITVLYEPISETNRQSLLSGSFNERVFMPSVLSGYIEEEEIILDIGAHTGLWTIPLAKKAVAGVVYALEPEPESFQAVQRNTRINNLCNVHTLQIAIADADGAGDFYVRPGSELHSLFEDNPLGISDNQYKIRVTTTRIDSLVESKRILPPTFVKIDAEGAEPLVLESIENSLVSFIRHILVEVHLLSLIAQGYTNPLIAVESKLGKLGFGRVFYLDEIHLIASTL